MKSVAVADAVAIAIAEPYVLVPRIVPPADWFPSNPWRLRPGPSIVAVLERSADFAAATTELWLPVERA